MAHIPQSRNVIAAFTQESRLPDKRLNIPARGSIVERVCEKLTQNEIDNLIGVKDASGNNWID